MNITIDTTDVRRVTDGLKEFSERRFRAAVATAITRTAREVEADWRRQFGGSLDRPTPLTRRAGVVQGATAQNLQAVVALREQTAAGASPAEYLAPQETGGARGVKKFEAALQRAGVMQRGQRAVPGRGAKLDAYGNVSRSQIVQVLSQLAAGRTSVGYTRVIGRTQGKRDAARRRAGREYVAISRPEGGLSAGIYERQGRGLVAVFVFVAGVKYNRRLSLIERGSRIANAAATANLQAAVAQQIQRLQDKLRRAGAS